MTKTLRDQLSKIESLGEGWDGHNAPRIGTKITDKAWRMIGCVVADPKIVHAAPMSDGGVMLEWQDDEREYSLEVSPK